MIKTYAHHNPTSDCTDKIKQLRQAFSELHAKIEALAPASREKSVAFTHLETAAMWAIKATVCNDPASEVEFDV